MVHRKRIDALARTAFAVFIGMALGACSASIYPASTAETPGPPTRESDTADSGSVLPEVVVTAPRLSSPRVAEDASSRPPAKLGT
jgi:hypothetical protein